MNASELKVGAIYGNSDTRYRLDRIDDDRRITATPVRGPFMPQKDVGRQRERFCGLDRFARWAEQEFKNV